jgi:ABC-type polysaccharide/polyol phosphate export permease
MNLIRLILQYRDLLINLVARDLKSRYRGSALGLLWTILTPLFMALIYMFFLRLLMGRGVVIRHEEIIIGVFAWQFTVQAMTSGMNAITGSANLVKKIYFPRLIIPLATSLSALINYLLMLVVQLILVAVILALGDSHLSLSAIAIPVILLYHFMFNLSLALLTAAANVYFRDTQHLVNLFLSAWFFVSPVMYSLTLVDAMASSHTWIRELYMLNPMAIIITAYRTLQIPGELFPWSVGALIGLIWPFLLFAGSFIFYQRSSRYFADWL